MKLLVRDTLVSQALGSLGSTQYQYLWVEDEGLRKNIVEDGEHSCAYFITSLLHNLRLLDRMHATIKTTRPDLERHGWVLVREPKPGAVIIWEEQRGHEHIGIYIQDEEAISNSTSLRVPKIHDWLFRSDQTPDGRKAVEIYVHPSLDD